MEVLQAFLLPGAWIALLTLVFLEIVLGVDNIVFLTIMTSKLPAGTQKHGRTTGLLLAMFARIGLLFGVSILMRLTKPLFAFDTSWISGVISGQSIIILLGGLFLLYKSVSEIHEKLETTGKTTVAPKYNNFWAIMMQIVLLDIVFSFDSVLTAVGMVSFKDYGYTGAITIMVSAIIISVMVMMFFSGAVSKFINQHPTIQMLALSFLILIGLMLVLEAAYLSHLNIFGHETAEVPKGYIYFAIAFALLVEFLNSKLKKKPAGNEQKPVKQPSNTI